VRGGPLLVCPDGWAMPPTTAARAALRELRRTGTVDLGPMRVDRVGTVGMVTIERELGAIHKMYRGHPLGDVADGDLEERREKPWIAAVETFAIGGACQWLLVMDRVISAHDAYFNLPARKEGIVPGCANLRLPRLVGERATRPAIFFNRTFAAATPEGRLIADELVDGSQMEDAIADAAAELTSAGAISLLANRRLLRVAQEPLAAFRRYMAGYARDQARCLYSPALIGNLEHNWNARDRVGA
jgi:thioesterase DpgC